MRNVRLASTVLLLLGIAYGAHADELTWPSTPPENCPFAPSSTVTGLVFTGRHARYTEADGWYPSWAADGNLYSSFSDGKVEDTLSVSLSGWIPGGPSLSLTGQAVISGDDPLALTVRSLGVTSSDCGPYYARYPSGMLVHNGVWYYGMYCVHPYLKVEHEGNIYAGPWLGPFVGFRWSTDGGKSWTQSPCTAEKPLFGESALHGEPLKIGAPNFVDFGKNMEHSPDGKAYLVAHGAADGKDRRFAFNSWITGDEVYLIRVAPTIANINDRTRYEFYAGRDEQGEARWTSDFKNIEPIARWRDNMGWVMMTYNAPLKKYLMCVTDGVITTTKYNTYILEADEVTGPWRLVTYMKDFGEQAYFVNFPSKFIGPDGRTLWLCYGANYSDGWNKVHFKARPEGSGYGMCLQEVRLTSAPAAPVPAKKTAPPEQGTGAEKPAPPELESVAPDLSVPETTDDAPAPGRRVRQRLPRYEGTEVYHVLYLPTDWTPGNRYPVIVEYAGNGGYKNAEGGDVCTGLPEGSKLGYGSSGGKGFIWVCLPYVNDVEKKNAIVWFGHAPATVDYCLEATRMICEQWGGDPGAVLLTGFSRGAIACNYIGLYDERIADVWLAFIPYSFYDGLIEWQDFERADNASALERLGRLKGRASFICEEKKPFGKVWVNGTNWTKKYLAENNADGIFTFANLPFRNHNDAWVLRDIPERRQLRDWVAEVLRDPPGTCAVAGRVTDEHGHGLAGVRVESGGTHWTVTDASGQYTLSSLVDGPRTIRALMPGRRIVPEEAEVTLKDADVEQVDFKVLD